MRVEKYNAVRYLYTLYDFSFPPKLDSTVCFFRGRLRAWFEQGGNYVRQSNRL
jgi:hypothetical protein